MYEISNKKHRKIHNYLINKTLFHTLWLASNIPSLFLSPMCATLGLTNQEKKIFSSLNSENTSLPTIH